MDTERREGDPFDGPTAIADEMLEAGKRDGVRVIAFVTTLDEDGKPARSGIGIGNYDDDNEAIVDLFIHLKALFEAQGKTLMFAPLGEG
jgi:hypothetical protein